MPNLEELRSQIADLEKQAAELHDRESREAIATVVELVRKYGLTAEQVGLAPASPTARKATRSRAAPQKSSRPGAGVAKYADPASGKTWTGFGKPPAWIAGAKDRNAFLIEQGNATSAPTGKSAVKKTRDRKPKTV